MKSEEVLDESRALRALLRQATKKIEAMEQENAALRAVCSAVVFDVDKAGRVSSSTMERLRAAGEGR